MMRRWTGIAVLSGSWLFGLGYYDPARPAIWLCALAVATVLLYGVPIAWPRRSRLLPAVLALLPAIWLIPSPYKAVPLMLALACIAVWLALPRRETRQLAAGGATAALVLGVQALVIEAYAILTARAHELPGVLSWLLGLVPRWLGLDTVVDGSWIVIRHAGQMHRVAAVWDLLFDPASVCFFAGGTVLLILQQGRSFRGGILWRLWLRDVVCLLGIVVAWAPLRSAVLLSLWLHRAIRADAMTEPNVASVFVNSWLHVGLLAGLVILAAWLLPLRARDTRENTVRRRHGRRHARQLWPATLLTAAGVATVVFLVTWCPVGKPKSGRVLVVERHATWEPTQVPYGTDVYGETGSYNYAAAYDYCGQYFQMSRLLESDAIDDRALASCDVLVIKTPTSRYTAEEVDAVVRFVDAGGSLLMIGDHTNVFNMNTCLNDVSRHFGFTFRNDLLFRVGSPYTQEYQPPRAAHPAIQHVPPMNFAVSCSIDPGRSRGRMVIRNTGLYNLPPAYHESNYHPQAEYRPHMQYGAWCQMWATSYGRGRVLAFADSTLFSNFCVFQPGKAELLRGTLAWLNRRSVLDRAVAGLSVRIPLGLLAASLIGWGPFLARDRAGSWLVLLCWSLGAGAAVSAAVATWQQAALPVPELKRPLPHVVVDRELSEVPLFTGAFADADEGIGYGMLEQWIPRIGTTISRRDDQTVFAGDGLIVVCPTRSVQDAYRDAATRYVRSGGHLLVIDTPDVVNSTANGLLAPFGLTIHRETAAQLAGELVWPDSGEVPGQELQMSCEVRGGQPLAVIGDIPVAAQVQYGEGTVTAVGFGSLFNDAAMGYHWLPEPDETLRQRYEVLYHLLRTALPPPGQTDAARKSRDVRSVSP